MVLRLFLRLHYDLLTRSKEVGPRIAAMFSIVESCRKLGVPIRPYLADMAAWPRRTLHPVPIRNRSYGLRRQDSKVTFPPSAGPINNAVGGTHPDVRHSSLACSIRGDSGEELLWENKNL